MQDLFVPYKLALKLIEKGFDEECFATHEYNKWLDTSNSKSYYYNSIKAPLYQQVIDWFREKYNIIVEYLVFNRGWIEKDKFCFQWRIYNNCNEWFTNTIEYKTPYEALNTAIEEALKLI